MEAIMIAAGIAALLCTPMITLMVMWMTGQREASDGDRPDPPQTNRTSRTIPGSDSGRAKQ
jgi:hypothetical protein